MVFGSSLAGRKEGHGATSYLHTVGSWVSRVGEYTVVLGPSRAERSEARCDGVPACWLSRSVQKMTPLLWVLVARVSTRLGSEPYTPLAKSHFEGAFPSRA
eukprot:1839088-Prymnesium_polylepis.1